MIGGVAWARLGREGAGPQPEKMKRRVLAVGRVLVRKGFVLKEEDLG